MCVILSCETNRPTLQTLLDCELDNPHGAGIAWRQGGKIHFKKGLDAQEVHRISLKVQLPYVIHFRIATAGGMSPEMCHPFPIGGSVRMDGSTGSGVLFHNGHWSEWEDTFLSALVSGRDRRLPTGDISDTRAMAVMLGWYGKNILNLIKGQKFVYFTPTEHEVLGWGWSELNGIKFSNMYWQNNSRHYNSRVYGYWDKDNHTWVDSEYAKPSVNESTLVRLPNGSTAVEVSAATPNKSAAESASVFTSASAAIGVTEDEIAELEQQYGLHVGKDGHLYSAGGQTIEELELAEEPEKVVVGTFGNNQPITVPNS